MGRTMHRTMMMITGTVAVGALALGGAEVAGAATNAWVASAGSAPGASAAASAGGPTGTAVPGKATTGTTAPAAGSGRLAHLDCARAPRVLARIGRREAHIAAGLPKLTRAEAKAKAAGKTRRAGRIERLITRLERPAYRARLAAAAAGLEARCHVPAPPTAPAAATGSHG